MTLRRAWPFLAIGGVLAVAAAWQTAQQASDQDIKYKELSDSITGGDSYAEIIPEGHDTVSYAILNVGRSVLSNVSITLVHMENPPNAEGPTNIPVGTLAPSTTPNFKFVPLPITPTLDEKFSMMIEGERVDTYTLLINAPNGTAFELIQFRKGKCVPWATRYKIQPPPQLNKPAKGFTEWADGNC